MGKWKAEGFDFGIWILARPGATALIMLSHIGALIRLPFIKTTFTFTVWARDRGLKDQSSEDIWQMSQNRGQMTEVR